jgi:hypothetical protein
MKVLIQSLPPIEALAKMGCWIKLMLFGAQVEPCIERHVQKPA